MVKGLIGLCGALSSEVFTPNSLIDFYTSSLTAHVGPVAGRSLVKIAQMVELIRYQLSAGEDVEELARRDSPTRTSYCFHRRRMCNPRQFLSNILRGKYEIYMPAFYGTLRHIWVYC